MVRCPVPEARPAEEEQVMRRYDLRENLVPLLTLAGTAVAGPALLLGFVGHHAVHLSGTVHFAGVGVSALAAAAVAGSNGWGRNPGVS